MRTTPSPSPPQREAPSSDLARPLPETLTARPAQTRALPTPSPILDAPHMLLRLLVTSLLLAPSACHQRSSPPPAPQAPNTTQPPPPTARLDGAIRHNDRWLPVAPTILHDAKMDLATRCLLLRDDAKTQGRTLPVCYERAPSATPLTRLVIRRAPTLPVAMSHLTVANEAAHFTIDPDGTVFQILDLAFAPRRAGAYHPGEIDVISTNPAAEATLTAALSTLFPGLQIETTPLGPPPTPTPSPTPTPTPLAPAPTP